MVQTCEESWNARKIQHPSMLHNGKWALEYWWFFSSFCAMIFSSPTDATIKETHILHSFHFLAALWVDAYLVFLTCFLLLPIRLTSCLASNWKVTKKFLIFSMAKNVTKWLKIFFLVNQLQSNLQAILVTMRFFLNSLRFSHHRSIFILRENSLPQPDNPLKVLKKDDKLMPNCPHFRFRLLANWRKLRSWLVIYFLSKMQKW